MQNRDIFSIFFNMEECCVFSLESPHRSYSNEYTQYTIFNTRQEDHSGPVSLPWDTIANYMGMAAILTFKS